MNRPVLAALLAFVSTVASAGEARAAPREMPETTTPAAAPARSGHAESILAGIGNHGRNPRQPYVTAGDRAYLIGTQDGNFPDMGQHVPGEMGGLWVPPIKLVDGFEARIADATTGNDVALADSAEMVAYPYGNRFIHGRVLDGVEVERFQFSPDGQPVDAVPSGIRMEGRKNRVLIVSANQAGQPGSR